MDTFKNICCLYFLLVVGNAFAQNSENAILSNIDYSLTNYQVLKLSESSMDGDLVAAKRVSDYYEFVKKNKEKGMYWAMVGAENGSPEMQFRLFQKMASSSQINIQRRALFWLRRSASGGNENAKALFNFCAAIDAKMNDVDHSPCFGPKSEH
jgi:hypothetical protein